MPSHTSYKTTQSSTVLLQQDVCKEEEEVDSDQQLCDQERYSSLDQEDPDPLQIKEEQEEVCTCQEGEQLIVKQETDTFMLTSVCRETDHSETDSKSCKRCCGLLKHEGFHAGKCCSICKPSSEVPYSAVCVACVYILKCLCPLKCKSSIAFVLCSFRTPSATCNM